MGGPASGDAPLKYVDVDGEQLPVFDGTQEIQPYRKYVADGVLYELEDFVVETLRAQLEREAEARRQKEEMLANMQRPYFRRSNLLAEDYAVVMRESSLTFLVSGGLLPRAKDELTNLGFTCRRAKSSLIKVVAAKLDPDDHESIEIARSISRGVLTMLNYSDPLQLLANDEKKLKQIESFVPLKDPAKGKYKTNESIIVAAYIRNSESTKKNLWLSRAAMKTLLDNIRTISAGIENLEDLSVHQLYSARLVSRLKHQLGVVRTPLMKPAQTTSSTLSKIPRNLAHTIAKVLALRQTEKEQRTL